VTPEPIAVRADPPAVLDLPPAHLELAWRPLQDRDTDALHGLITTIEEADRVPRRTSREEVVEMLEVPWRDLHTDSLAGFDHGGVLRAYGMVEVRPSDVRCVRAFLAGGVHPDWRGGGLGRAIVAWMEGRGRQLLAATGRSGPARLAAYVEETARDYRRLYAAAGFSPIRWYTEMRRDLSLPLPEAAVPPGCRILPWRPELDDAVRLAHNAAFADHWGSEPHSPESWAQRSHFAPEWSLVALDDGDRVVGYLVSERFEQDWEVQGVTSAHTRLLGVRREWRGRGLAAALLVRAMEIYQADGIRVATLDVDTANPTGAHGLYARLGYEPSHGQVLYSVEI
jgi:GNAT superfamily N-acetyltransferase